MSTQITAYSLQLKQKTLLSTVYCLLFTNAGGTHA